MGRPAKSFVADNERLINEWDFNANNEIGLDPKKIGCGSHYMAFWICSKCGNKWNAEIKARHHGNGCPVCGKAKQLATLNQNLIKQKGSLFENNPELAKEWHPTKNLPLTPNDVLQNSNKKVYWQCSKCNYVWPQIISVRNSGIGCPVCSNRTIIKGENDLATTNPWLASEWHPYKNGNLRPDQISYGSDKKVYWKCRICGHEWPATIASRSRGNGCPKCRYSKQISFQEKAVFYYVSKVFDNAIENYSPKWLTPREIDIYLPNAQIGIEYDGEQWHKNPQKDEDKDLICIKHGINVIHLREPLCPDANLKTTIKIQSRSLVCLEIAIMELFNILQKRTQLLLNIPHINILEDTISIMKMMELRIRENSFALKFPRLVDEWDYEANAPFVPEQFSPVSGKYVYWICSKGHKWRARIANRSNGNGCPFCDGKRVLAGYNDLASQYPIIANEWHPTMNGELTPNQITPSSNKQVYWLCKNNHYWKAPPRARVKGCNCPYCMNIKVWKGFNDLASVYPQIAKEWSRKNIGITPDDIYFKSTKKCWWHCELCGHEWKTEVRVRARGANCPKCADRMRGKTTK